MCKGLGLLLIIVGGFLVFEGFDRKDSMTAQSDAALAAGWLNSLESSPHSGQQMFFLAGGAALIVAGVTVGTRCRPKEP